MNDVEIGIYPHGWNTVQVGAPGWVIMLSESVRLNTLPVPKCLLTWVAGR